MEQAQPIRGRTMGQGNKVTESHRILVVDDEPDIRDLIVETLTPVHQVTAAYTLSRRSTAAGGNASTWRW